MDLLSIRWWICVVKVNQKEAKKISLEYSLRANKEKILGNFDMLIACSGFEDRTIGLMKNLGCETKIKNFVIFLYHPQEENLYIKNLQSLGHFKKYMRDLNIDKNQVVHIDPTNPWEFKKILTRMVSENKINDKSRVLVDITSFTRAFLYEIINALYLSGCSFTCAYTEPKDYVTILPTGVNRVIVSPSFSGEPRPNHKSFLLLFLGWETGRTRGVFDAYNSDEQIGVIGISSIDKKHIEWSKKSIERNKDLMEEIKNIEYCSTLDFDKIMNFLIEIYERKEHEYYNKNEKFYFAISGLGPKIQNLASCIFAICKNDIQLIYGAPAYWGSSEVIPIEKPIESQGIGKVYIYGPFTKKTIDNMF